MTTFSRAGTLPRRGSALWLLRLEGVLLASVGFAVSAVPRALPILLGLLALVAAVHVLVVDRKRPLVLLRAPLGIALAVFITYLFINSSWATDRPAAIAKAGSVALMAVAALLIAASVSLREGADAGVLARWTLAGLLLGIAFLLVELVFGEPIMRFLDNHVVHLFNASPKKAKVVNGEVTRVKDFVLNRNVTSLVMLLIPGMFFTSNLATVRARRGFLGALVVGALACVLLSQSGTSVVALIVGGAVLALAAFSLPATRYLLAAGWIVATLLAVPLCSLPYALGWQHVTWLPPDSVVARFYIWRYTAEKVYERPITGIGIRNTRTIPTQVLTKKDNPFYTLRPGRHAHNVFLQIWLELGGIGALLFCVLGIAVLWQLQFWPSLVEAGAYGLFAAVAAIGLSGFDLWQTWLIASLALAWIAMLLAARLPVAWQGFRKPA